MGHHLLAALAVTVTVTASAVDPNDTNDILDINGYFKPGALHDPFLAIGLPAYVVAMVGGLILLSRRRKP